MNKLRAWVEQAVRDYLKDHLIPMVQSTMRFNNTIREGVLELSKEEWSRMIKEVHQLDPRNQYIFVVRNDEALRELSEGFRKYLDLDNGPRIIVVSALDVKLIEIDHIER